MEDEVNQIRFVRLRSVVLLAALLGLILSIPIRATDGTPSITSQMLNTALFCFAGYLLAMSRKWVMGYLVLAVPTFIIGIITSTYPGYNDFDLVRDILTLVLQCLLIYAVLKFSLLNRKAAELDRIIAGVCGYLILGLLWTDIYAVVLHFTPGAIQYSNGDPAQVGDGSLAYFSFVTLTTLGYGDISPKTPWTRILASIEAIMGTLYLAVLIASLMSGFRMKQKK